MKKRSLFFMISMLLLVFFLNGCKSDEIGTETIKSAEQLNDSSYTIGVPQGAAAMYAGEKFFTKAKIEYYQSLTDGYTAVEYGKLDAFVYDRHALEYAVFNNKKLALLDDKIADEPIVIGSTFGKEALIEKINTFIADYKSSGLYEDMYDRWIRGGNLTMPEIEKPENPTMKLRVGTSGLNEPMNYFGPNGELTGFDVEFARRLALFLNADLEIKNMTFEGLLASTTSGKLDLLVANLNGTDAVKEVMLVSNPYIDSEIAVLISSKSKGISSDKGGGFLTELKASFIKNFITEDRWKMIVQGLGVTLLISALSAIFGIILGFGVCMMRRSGYQILVISAKVFIRILQGTPVVVLLMLLYYVVFGSTDINAILIAVFGFTLNFAAYVSEMMRSGIDAVDKGQVEAANAIGFNKSQTFIKIVFPQAARHFLPVLKGEFISMVKMTSVVGYIAIKDLTKMSDIIRSRTYEAFFPLITTALIYFAVAYLFVLLLGFIEVKIDPKHRDRIVKGVRAE